MEAGTLTHTRVRGRLSPGVNRLLVLGILALPAIAAAPSPKPSSGQSSESGSPWLYGIWTAIGAVLGALIAGFVARSVAKQQHNTAKLAIDASKENTQDTLDTQRKNTQDTLQEQRRSLELTLTEQHNRILDDWSRQLKRDERDHHREVYSAAVYALRNYMHALSDYADFMYRVKNNANPQIMISETDLARRVLETDREMLRQESVIRILSVDEVRYAYGREVSTLRDIRKMVDHGTNTLRREDVHPEAGEWKTAEENYKQAMDAFVRRAQRDIFDLAQRIPEADSETT
jgi:hypothetical protein